MGRRKERDAVVFLNEQLKMAGEVLCESEMGRLVNMLRAYSMERIRPDLEAESRLFRSIYAMMQSAQDKAIEKYEETCERNRERALKRSQPSAAAAAGGSHGSQSNLIKSNQIKSNQEDGDLSDHEGTGVPGVGWL